MKDATERTTRTPRALASRIHPIARARAHTIASADRTAMVWGSTTNDDTGEPEPAWCPASLLETPMLRAMLDSPAGFVSCDGKELPLPVVQALIRTAKACAAAANTLPAGPAQAQAATAALDALHALASLGLVVPDSSRAPMQARPGAG